MELTYFYKSTYINNVNDNDQTIINNTHNDNDTNNFNNTDNNYNTDNYNDYNYNQDGGANVGGYY